MIASPCHRRGNIFAMLFAAVALTGVLASVGMQTLTGPVTSITRVTQKNIADNNLLMNAKIIVNAAVTGVTGGDVDMDGIVEPASFAPAGGGETPPVNGGYLPTNLGLALTDPWGTKFGYCVWDHGAANSSANRITGDNTPSAATQPVIAVIAAGADKIFQTTCSAYAGGQVTAAKAGGSDDLIFKYTYAEATASSNGLWTLNTTNQAKAELKDSGGTANVSINRSTGVGDFLGIITSTIDSKLGELINIGGALKLDTAGATVDTCDAATKGALRLNATETALEVCDGAGGWGPVKAPPAGSAGQVQFNNGSGAFGADANLYWDNTNKRLGIGTTAPALRLHVSDGAQFYGVTAGASPSGVDYAYPYETVGVAAWMNLRLQSPNSIVFHSGMTATEPDDNSKARMFIGPTGNVGIGTTNPLTKLHLALGAGTDVMFNQLSSYNYISLNGLSNNANYFTTGNIGIIGGNGSDPVLYVDATPRPPLPPPPPPGAIKFRTNGNNVRATIDAGGNVGIGTASPAGQLDVANSFYTSQGRLVVRDQGVAGEGGEITLLGQGANNAWSIDNKDGRYRWHHDASEYAAITPTGNVGIGTSTPQSKLDVAGGVKVGADAVCNASKAGLIAWNTSQLQICDGTAFRNVRAIDALDDVGDVYLSESGNAEPGNNEILAWNATDDRWEAKNINVVGSAVATPDGADKQVQFNDGGALAGTSQMYWDKTNSRLGIGTAVPSNELHVFSTMAGAKAAQFEVTGTHDPTTTGMAGIMLTDRDNTTSSLWGLTFSSYDTTDVGRHASAIAAGKESDWVGGSGNYAGYLGFWTRPAGGEEIERLRITSTGNVGIGTTMPVARLDVAGGARVGADAVCSAAKAGMLAWNSNTLQVCTDAGTFTNIASSSGGASQWSSGASGAIYYNGGNVGIGISAPGAMLDVANGSIQCCATQTPNISLAQPSNVNGYMSWLQFHNSGEAEGYIRLAGGAASGIRSGQRRFEIGDSQSVGTSLTVTGSIGIGTTSPLAGLHVHDRQIAATSTYGLAASTSYAYASLALDSGTSTKTLILHFGDGNDLRFGRFANGFGGWEANPYRFDMDAPESTIVATEAGNVGIGTTGTGYKLDVAGSINSTGWYYFTAGLPATGPSTLCSSNGGGSGYMGYCSSDRRLKENIRYLKNNDGLKAVMNLKPARFQWKMGDHRPSAGFIAQDAMTVIPEAVYDVPSGEFYGFDINAIVSYSVKAIQELKAENDNQAAEIDDLRREIDALKAAR